MKSLFWSGVFQQTQALSQLCAFRSPFSVSMSDVEIYRQHCQGIDCLPLVSHCLSPITLRGMRTGQSILFSRKVSNFTRSAGAIFKN